MLIKKINLIGNNMLQNSDNCLFSNKIKNILQLRFVVSHSSGGSQAWIQKS